MTIAIARPSIDEREIEAVVAVMRTGSLAQGDTVAEFEKKFAAEFAHSHTAAITNGTAALHIALLSAGVQPGDRVLTTPFSFIATTNAIIYCGAVPCFVDIDEYSFNLSPENLEASIAKYPDAKYLLLVHLFGNPCRMDEIMNIANKHNITVIEDCAQAHGAEFDARPVGTFGIGGTFSFYPTKNMTTGEGGMLVSSDVAYIERCKKLINHGSSERYVHDITGYNYRLTNIAAAIGLVQADKVREMNHRRKLNAAYYNANIANEWLRLPEASARANHVFHQYTIVTDERDKLEAYLNKHAIGYGIYYPIPIHLQRSVMEYMRHAGQSIERMPVAEALSTKVISIPVHSQLPEEEVLYIAEKLNGFRP
ncbi:DegT/DnrJ/EryC1/StrS family aminotransferase [Paenibacillus lycopersici]|uniref:DegT/DnrJ/EryC1/StrS family aminotransferase n=1 Tax=Paenibacillus lycopersici TaxID=2704462 RepID=A0A6C0G1S9_9BACL|nr:DegT/DnrJ/EryC1/StrS family aminotransferase [Paenibacillus lycopersici]QHT63428.1 DegT/DnrJ/EryC1/StrS family aminotransferase [Paenibacillus lycopersici]